MIISQLEKLCQRVDEAHTALAAEQPSVALEYAKWALNKAPDYSEARLVEVRAHLAMGHPELALMSLDTHDLYHPDMRDEPEVAFLRARAMIRTRKLEEAEALLNDLIRRFPDDVRPRRMMGGLCMVLGKSQCAERHLRQVVVLEPNDQAAMRALAKLTEESSPQRSAEMLVGQWAAANQSELKLTDAPSALRAARLFFKAGQYCDAEELYRQLTVIDPEDATVWREAGEVAAAMGADEMATERLQMASTLSRHDDNESAAALASLARAHMHAGRFEKAGRSWWRATRRCVDSTESWAGLKICALITGRERLVERASDVLKFVADREDRQEALSWMWVHASCGMEIGRALDRHAPYRLPAQSPLDALLNRALDRLDAEAKANPEYADVHHHLAKIHHALGEDSAAIMSNTTALMINPNYKAARKLADEIAPRQAA